MAGNDLTRIRSNTQAQRMLANLRQVNAGLAIHQLRVGTGVRINSAADDPAGLTISTKLRSSYRVYDALYDNAGTARNMLAVAEGGLMAISDILSSMSEKIVQASSDTLGTTERQAVTQELVELVAEVDDIAAEAAFNGQTLLDQTRTLNFQTGPRSQTSWTSAPYDVASMGMANLAALTGTDTIDGTNYTDYLDEVENALEITSCGLNGLGAVMNRLTAKESMITVTRNNTEAAFNRIYHADIAAEQIEVTKSLVLQETAISMLAQANANARAVLELYA